MRKLTIAELKALAARAKAERAANRAAQRKVHQAKNMVKAAAVTNEFHRKRILTLDIESSPIEAYVWGLWDQNIGLDFIKTEWTILSYSAKWLGERKVYYGDTGGRGASKVRDDKKLVGEIRDLLEQADIVVAQNGKKFDVRKINARLIEYGYAPPRPYRVVDTLVSARKYFAFTSQKLAWTSQHLTDVPKDDHRRFPGFELWVECLKDNPTAWREMKKYNKRDVESTEQVYLKLRPWIDNHPNLSVYEPSKDPTCPKCSSKNLQHHGTRHTQNSQYAQLQCQDCGGWSRGKEMLTPFKVRRTQLVPI